MIDSALYSYVELHAPGVFEFEGMLVGLLVFPKAEK
jgi:hypothetical protein